MVTDYSK